jgi:hypothetical protein
VLGSPLGVDYTCILNVQFGCAAREPSAAVTCVFDVQQNLRPITLNAAHIAASCAAQRCAAQTQHYAACSAAWVFEYSGQKIAGRRK